MEEKNVKSNGIGFFTVLFIVFLILKLTNVITWSWIWVCAPLWIPLAFVLIILVGGLIVAGISVRR